MLDSDLAKLYGVETKRLKEQVKRNLERFPDDFMFELTKEELRHFGESFKGNVRPKYTSYVFTENGVAPGSNAFDCFK